MEVVFQGRLSSDQPIKEVLEDVLALKDGEHGVLRISAPGEGLNGGINLYKHRYIVGAYLSDSAESGYPAVRKLLSVSEGNFAYMDSPTAPPEHESVCIDVAALLELLPDLPEVLPGTIQAEIEQPARRAATQEIENAAALVRQTTQSAPSQSGPETLPQLREMQKRSGLGRKLAFWGGLAVAAAVALTFLMPAAQRFIEGNQTLKKMDANLKNRIQGEPEAAPAAQTESPPPPPKPARKKRHRHRH